jgi:hypothetical protein
VRLQRLAQDRRRLLAFLAAERVAAVLVAAGLRNNDAGLCIT